MANVLSADRQRAVLGLLVKGNSIRSTERLIDVMRDTIADWLFASVRRAAR